MTRSHFMIGRGSCFHHDVKTASSATLFLLRQPTSRSVLRTLRQSGSFALPIWSGSRLTNVPASTMPYKVVTAARRVFGG